MEKIEKIIKERLLQTGDCKFKKAWLPKGWACVNIKIFVPELAKAIKEKMKTWRL